MSIEKVLCISDLHCGSHHSIGVEGVELEEGRFSYNTKFQNGILKVFENQLDRVFDKLKGKKFTLILNGDLVDGKHHGDPFVENLISDQIIILTAVLGRVTLKANSGQIERTYFMQGTQAHAGIGNDTERGIAEKYNGELNVKATSGGSKIWQEMELEFANGAVLHTTHHFNFTNIYEGTCYEREWTQIGKSYLKAGMMPPDIYYRGHIHQFGNPFVLPSHPRTEIGCFSTPGWQGKSQYVMKGMGRMKMLQLGMVLLEIEDGKVVLRDFIDTLKPHAEEIQK